MTIIIALLGTLMFGVLIAVLIKVTTDNYKINGAIGGKLVMVEPIIKQQAKHTGYSVGYTSRGTVTTHEHYKYEDVIVNYRHTYRVTYKDGSVREVWCLKGDKVDRALSRFEWKIPM